MAKIWLRSSLMSSLPWVEPSCDAGGVGKGGCREREENLSKVVAREPAGRGGIVETCKVGVTRIREVESAIVYGDNAAM